MEKKYRIYIDMDNTLCDYYKAMRQYKDTGEFPQSREGFFRELDPYPGAIESFNYLNEKHDVWILTRPSYRNISCYTEKAQWVLEHLGFEAQKKTILCGDKSLVKGDFLIDDHHINGQPDFEGIWIQIGSEDYPDWLSVLKKIDSHYPEDIPKK